jgi:hypothetical protein
VQVGQAAQTIRVAPNRHNVMSNKSGPTDDPVKPMVYQIRIEGHLGPEWTDWFGGMSITLAENGETLLIGPVVDQAALHGLLKRVRDVGLTLLSFHRIESGDEDAPETKS